MRRADDRAIERLTRAHNKALRLVAVAVALLVVFGPLMGGAGAVSQTVTSVADSFTSEAFPSANYATVSYLKVQGGSARNGYVKFTVSGWSGPVGKATLKFWTLTSHATGFDVRSVSDNTWSETTLTYNNAPPFSSTVTASSGPFADRVWVSLDVTPLVSGNGTYSLALTTSSPDYLQVASKDNGSSTAPRLILDSPGAPVNTSLPTISGTPQDGQTLTASPGTWTGAPPPTYTYQWKRCDGTGGGCSDIAGAIGTTYTAGVADLGGTIRVAVTATNLAGSSTAASAQTAVVSAAAPSNVAPPSITGTAQDGQTLTANTGSWSGTPPISYAYQWRSCNPAGAGCADIAGATASTYALAPTDVGTTVRVAVTASNAGGSSTAVSNATAVVGAVPPTNNSAPTVSGTPRDGETLTAGSGSWSGTPPLAYAYQWRRCNAGGGGCVDIIPFNGSSYTLAAADIGSTIRVAVTASNWAGSSTAVSSATAVVVAAPPVNTAAPTVSGTARDGSTLNVAAGTWTGTAPITYAYQWRRCDTAGGNCSDITGATASTYAVVPADVGATIRIAVTASNSGGTTTATSSATNVVAPLPPSNTASPTVTGTEQEGQTLTVSAGSWSGTPPLTYAYQWRRCDPGSNCVDVDGATSTTYALTAADVGMTVRVAVTASNSGGSATAVSAPTGIIVSVSASPPTNNSPPTISGVARDGNTLTADPGSWSGQPPITYTYQWRRCDTNGGACADIAGATAQTYVLAPADVGSTIRVTVTASNADGAGTATSAATATVAPAQPGNTGAPTISGVAQDMQTLTASPGSWSGTPPISYAYQWRRCDFGNLVCSDITGATSQTYTVVAGDVGATLRVVVTASNAGGTSTATSAATAVVVAAPENTALPTISGTAEEGHTLTADSGTWTGTPPITYSYQWLRCDAEGECGEIQGATGTSHTLTSGEIGASIRLEVTATNSGGASTADSQETAVVAPAAPVAPTNTLDPTISGTARENMTLTADPGSWSGTAPISFAYQWRRCDATGSSCSDLAGAAGQIYVLTPADVDATVRVIVTGSNVVGSGTAQSAQTDVVAAAPYQQVVLRDNPRGFWRLNEISGRTAGDTSSTNNAGSYSGGATLGVAGALLDTSTAVRFDGVDDRVIVNDPPNGSLDFGTSDFTVETWLKTSVNGEEAPISKQTTTGPYWDVTVSDDSGHVGHVRAKIDDGTVTRTVYGPSIRVDDGRWHYVAVLYDRDSGITIYVDGLSRFTAAAATGDVSNTSPLRIGFAANFPYFNGDLDEAAVYPTLLPTARLLAHYHGGVDTTAPLVNVINPAGGEATNDTTPIFNGTSGTVAGDAATVSVKIYNGTTPTGTPVETFTASRDSSGNWSAPAPIALAYGVYTGQASQADATGNTGISAPTTFTVSADPVIAAAGDIACDPADRNFNGGLGTATKCRHRYTSDRLADGGLAGVLALGDLQYECGGASAFLQSYDPTWGRVKSITHPAPGNHEYNEGGGTNCDTSGHASGYYGYFGAAAGDPTKGYYSYDIGGWHVIALNSNCDRIGGCQAGSPEEQWLAADLAAHPATCVLAYWHHPRFTSDAAGGNPDVTAFWQDLYAAGADVVLNGHAHNYERFALQDPSANADPANGIREFVVGTGGESFSSFSPPLPNTQIRDGKTFGVLELTLHPSGYDWKFIAETGAAFTDAGSTPCH
jgi:hypothetical protein